MGTRYKTWRSPVAIILLFLAAFSVFTGCRDIVAGKLPPDPEGRLAFLAANLLFAMLFGIPAKILFAKERAIGRPSPGSPAGAVRMRGMRLAAAILSFVIAAIGILWASLYALLLGVFLYQHGGGGWRAAFDALSQDIDLTKLAVAWIALAVGLGSLKLGGALLAANPPDPGWESGG